MSLMKYTETQILDRWTRLYPTILYEDYSEEHLYWCHRCKTVYFYTADVPPILIRSAKYVARVRVRVSQRLEAFNVPSIGGIY